MAEASRLPVTPVFHHTTGLRSNTQAGSERSMAMIAVIGHSRLLTAIMGLQGKGQWSGWLGSGGDGRHGEVDACPYPAVAVAPSPDVPSRLCGLGGVWWGRGRKVSALLGFEP